MATIRDLLSTSKSYTEPVSVGGMDIDMRAITLVEILRVIARFPELKNVFFGTDEQNLISVLISVGPDAIAALLACATLAPGDREVEAGILARPDDEILALLAKAVKLTMPDGIEAFFGRLAQLGVASGLLQPGDQSASAEAA